ncbi:MAG: hypothetical protein JF614_32825 [Acidobacteria bacterium]|nr:hypothetical protein [Acidobacteriota bacterium]
MFNVSIHSKAVLLVVLAVLVTPWASAAGQQSERPRSVRAVEPAALELFSPLWSFLRRVGSKAGCHIDPSGRCVKVPAQNTEIGCNIDPSGRCIS